MTATSTSGAVTSPPSNAVDFTVIPTPPVVTGPADGSSTSNPTPVITGTGEPGATVTITIDGDEVGTTTVDTDGNWTFTPDDDLPLGEHEITTTQTSGGATSEPSDPISVKVVAACFADADCATGATCNLDTNVCELPAPVVTGLVNGTRPTDRQPVVEGTGTDGTFVTITVGGNTYGPVEVVDGHWSIPVEDDLDFGDHTVTATATSGDVSSPPSNEVSFTVEPTPPVVTGPQDGDTTNDPTIAGTGEPGATVTIYVDGEEIGTTTVDEDGGWQFTPESGLPPGEHEITTTQTVGGATSEPSEPITVTVVDGCLQDSECADGASCDLKTNECVPPASGCDSDAQCGGPDSGLVCDAETQTCVEGCYLDEGRNQCPESLVCNAREEGVVGSCVAPEDKSRWGIQGGGFGFGCSTGADGSAGGLLLLAALTGLAITRRKSAHE